MHKLVHKQVYYIALSAYCIHALSWAHFGKLQMVEVLRNSWSVKNQFVIVFDPLANNIFRVAAWGWGTKCYIHEKFSFSQEISIHVLAVFVNKGFLFATSNRKIKSHVVENQITLLVWANLSLIFFTFIRTRTLWLSLSVLIAFPIFVPICSYLVLVTNTPHGVFLASYGWFEGQILYFNTQIRVYYILFTDETTDYVAAEDFDGTDLTLL